MDSLIIQETYKTPDVNFNPANGKMEIKGRSIPENPHEFFKLLNDWLDLYCSYPHQLTEVNIRLEYFNTSSSKCILDVLKKFGKIHDAGNKVVINWYYEKNDEDIFEVGEDYQEILEIPFNFIELEE